MWMYNYSTQNELYHYGIPGMKWGHRKRVVASTGGLSGYIRGKQMTNATNSLSAIGKRQRQVNSELKELRGYEKNPSAIGKTKLATAIRRSQIKSLEKTQSKLQKSKRDNEDALKELKSIDKYQDQKKAERESYKNFPEYKAKQAKIKKAAIAGAAVAGTALAAYGAYKLSNAIKNKAYQESYNKGKAIADKIYDKNIANRASEFKDGTYKLTNMYGETIRSGKISNNKNVYDIAYSNRKSVGYDYQKRLRRVSEEAENNSKNLKNAVTYLYKNRKRK